MPQTTLTAPDISCDHCISSIKGALDKLPGVTFVSGDPASKTVVVEYDAEQSGMEAIEAAMEDEGYPVQK
jgi:copper chaperone CopZ